MFILRALDKHGSFHAAKVLTIILMCNSFLEIMNKFVSAIKKPEENPLDSGCSPLT
jgi:hypothetical protein